MKITDVKPFVLGAAWRNITVLKVETDEGVYGLGEATTINRDKGLLGYLEEMKPRHVIGADPFDVEAIWRQVYAGDFIRGGWISASVQSAIDVACYDIMGKVLGVPVWKLVGGRFRQQVPTYANGWYTVDREPQALAERVHVVLDRGYRAFKIDPFGAGSKELSREEFRKSISILERLREEVGPDVDIFVEGHARFTVNTAVRLAKAMEAFEVGWFEEPCTWDYTLGWGEIRRRTTVPIAGGEHFFHRQMYREVFENRGLDIIQPDMNFIGGFTEMRKVAAMADTYELLVAPHNSQGPLNTAASLHFAVSCPNFKILESFDDFFEPHVLEAFPGAPRQTSGYFDLPNRPGLGVEINEEVFEKHPYKPLYFNLFKENWERRRALEL